MAGYSTLEDMEQSELPGEAGDHKGARRLRKGSFAGHGFSLLSSQNSWSSKPAWSTRTSLRTDRE